LLLFRGICKNAIQLAKEVNDKLIENHIHKLVKWPVANGYGPPCQTCIIGCATDLDKGNRHSSQMFALLLKQWKDTIKDEIISCLNHGLMARIREALFMPTAGNGLGLIMLMHTATEELGLLSYKSLAEYTMTKKSSHSWLLLSKFICRYLQPTEIPTYQWARLVNDGYFTEFTAKSHPYLAGMFAGIIDSFPHVIASTYDYDWHDWRQTLPCHLIKDSAWFKLKRLPAENGYRWGRAVAMKVWPKLNDLSIQTSN